MGYAEITLKISFLSETFRNAGKIFAGRGQKCGGCRGGNHADGALYKFFTGAADLA
jgi:hypothetical protein